MVNFEFCIMGKQIDTRNIGPNDLLRFLLEITSLIAYGYWGFVQDIAPLNYILMIILPVIVAIMWGVFRVPDDPSSSGKAPIVVPGIIRLLLELAIFIGASYWFYISGLMVFGIIFMIIVIIHYIISYKRINWLLKH